MPKTNESVRSELLKSMVAESPHKIVPLREKSQCNRNSEPEIPEFLS